MLVGGRPADDAILNLLQPSCEVHLSTELPDALERLRSQSFDAVLAAADDFLPLERALGTGQAASILDTIGEGACVVGFDGRLLWANAKFKAMSSDVSGSVVAQIAAALPDCGCGAGCVRWPVTDEGRRYEVTASGVRNGSGDLTHVTAVVFDVTETARNRERMEAITRAGRELAWLDGGALARMSVAERIKFLQERIVHYTGELLHREHFALWVHNERDRRLELIASKGLPAAMAERTVPVGDDEGGLPGCAAATGQSILCGDLAGEGRHRPLALADACSSLTVPVRLSDKVIGVLTFESHRKHAFTDQDRQFIEIFTGYIALALNTMNLLTVERHSATSEITGVVTSELCGPLADIRSEARALIAEYIGHDEMRKRLERIVATADSIEATVEHIAAQPAAAMMGTMPTTAADPIVAGKRILIADDEELIRDTICDVLTNAGAFVDTAVDGREAIERIEACRYDMVLSDIKMPFRNGYDVFSAAKARHPDTAVILITGFGYDPGHSIVRANPQGLAAVLFKPFKVAQLLEEVHAALTAEK